ncbi:FK506-binding protein 4 [Ceratocystis lukuohia]|uniref:FK506-binding protein n=2 Tax=Ceratocystis TaxID=5157 RepID=A0A0F8B589_CERFI|nr:FK506-binding protein 4 [Ceratocystis platani]
MSFLPVGVYGLEVPAGEILVPAARNVEAHFRITMAAIDPTASPVADAEGNIPEVPRSTLKLIRMPPNFDEEDEDDEDFDEEAMEALLNASDDEDDSEEENGGPSDPSKSKKSARAAALAKLIQAAKDEDDEMEDVKPNKGKGKSIAIDSDEEEEDDEDPENEPEEFVICTLDTQRNFQQPIDIHISEGEAVFFVVSGTHNVYLTGNYVIPPEDDDEDCDSCDEDEDYELPEDMEEDSEEESEEDELDDLANPRITEIESEEEAPKLVDTSAKKGKKRAAEENLDEMIKTDDKTKKQKNNQGKSVAAAETKKGDKKVQFAKQLEQGPTPSEKKVDAKPAAPAKAAAPSKRVVQGVTVDDRKVGAGRAAKKGDTVGMRYIGKLDNGKVFDANKKGKPFYFKLGKGEVIKGWDIGVSGMAIGGERRLTIPAPLAYGSKSLPGIPGNSQLTFDVKLLEIK